MWTKLFNCIVTSSIWLEDSDTKVVWVTMLAMADRNGTVNTSVRALAHSSGVALEATVAALEKFQAPDPDSRTMAHEGRRIERIEGGFKLLNHARYREAGREDTRAAYHREYQRQRRARAKLTSEPDDKPEGTELNLHKPGHQS